MVQIVVPVYRFVEGIQPNSPAFTEELTDVLSYARRRAEALENLPWANWALPRKYTIINNVGGYGTGFGYGIRTTDRALTSAELRSLAQLGVNGFRDPPDFVLDMLREGEPETEKWNRAMIAHIMGFPVDKYRPGRNEDPQAGCPFGEDVAKPTEQLVAESLESALSLPVEEVWGLTVDEIGTVIDASRGMKAHLSVCPRCIRGFREWLKGKGLKTSDFGVLDRSDVRPLNVWDSQSERPWLRDRGLALLCGENLCERAVHEEDRIHEAIQIFEQRRERQQDYGRDQRQDHGKDIVPEFGRLCVTQIGRGNRTGREEHHQAIDEEPEAAEDIARLHAHLG